MVYRIVILFFILGGLASHAQTVNLQGTVSNGDGDPISGAIVTLIEMDLKDTTGADGAYAFMQTTPVMNPHSTAWEFFTWF